MMKTPHSRHFPAERERVRQKTREFSRQKLLGNLALVLNFNREKKRASIMIMRILSSFPTQTYSQKYFTQISINILEAGNFEVDFTVICKFKTFLSVLNIYISVVILSEDLMLLSKQKFATPENFPLSFSLIHINSKVIHRFIG